MNQNAIRKKFEAMGARVRFSGPSTDNNLRGNADTLPVVIDVLNDRYGEFYDLTLGNIADLMVLDVDRGLRHLLLMARGEDGNNAVKILCGHDEREWFAAQVPGQGVRNIDTALEALKPDMAIAAQKRNKVGAKDRHRRKNKGYIRQGEWFFIPAEGLEPEPWRITQREPITVNARAGNKPHVADLAYREGGDSVWVHPQYAPNGMTIQQRSRLFVRNHKAAKASNWRMMTRNPELYVRGAIRHPDHKTIHLGSWHRVMLNQEVRAGRGRGGPVAFLD